MIGINGHYIQEANLHLMPILNSVANFLLIGAHDKGQKSLANGRIPQQ